MDIIQLTERINKLAIENGHSISRLPELRKSHLGKKQLPYSIFTSKTTFKGPDNYAFHYGGRDEMQFNIGEEEFKGKTYTRVGLCLSLEPSMSLQNPVEILEKYRIHFNDCLIKRSDLFVDFQFWSYHNGKRSENLSPRKIDTDLFQLNTFICLGRLIEKKISQLTDLDVSFILTTFDALLPIYRYCVLEDSQAIKSSRIFTRLTSNDNNWEIPSTHKWNTNNQGKKSVAFEHQYGFGHEEWLLNPRYNIGGYQYGYIRGIGNAKAGDTEFDEVHLYTVKTDLKTKDVYYIGVIKNVIVIRDNEIEQKTIKPIIDLFYNDMLREVDEINGDTAGLRKFRHIAVVKFKMTDVHLYDEPMFQPEFDLYTYKRFQPYSLSVPLNEIFELNLRLEDSVFTPGKSTQTGVYDRKNKASSKTIIKLHAEIVDALEQYLAPNYSIQNDNLSIEMTRFHGNIADVVAETSDRSIIIYEIKTSSSGRRNLREAIAQLLDYALHAKPLEVKKIVIVSPCKLNKMELEFLHAMKKHIKVKLEYLHYDKNLRDKFIIRE